MSSLKIAVADSSIYYRNMISSTLEEQKFNVVANVETSEKMIEIIQSHLANVFLIDVFIHDFGGIDLAQFILDNNEDVFIVMMSSLEIDSFFMGSVKARFFDYLKKPFECKEVIKTIARIQHQVEGD